MDLRPSLLITEVSTMMHACDQKLFSYNSSNSLSSLISINEVKVQYHSRQTSSFGSDIVRCVPNANVLMISIY